MGRKKRVVPGEVCTLCSERGKHHRKVMMNVQKSAEAIVVAGRRAELTGILSTTGKGGRADDSRKPWKQGLPAKG